ncbi:hypothetical protein AB0D12_38635 [Streptomyces sp. NPDC048479]|uniref:hypothetical protein n=1 Tax=Streptomyces sp. NPDC048479 TaxID=3154725 RepID=UPI0034131A35
MDSQSVRAAANIPRSTSGWDDGHLDLVAATVHGSRLKSFWIVPGTDSGFDTTATRHLSYKDLGLGG